MATTTTSLAAASRHHILLPSRSGPSFNPRTPNRVRLCPAFPSILCASTSSASPQPTAGGEEDEAGHGGKLSKQSSWEATDGQGDDYLYRLGKEAENMNIAVGARSGVIDDLFVGKFLGRDCMLPSAPPFFFEGISAPPFKPLDKVWYTPSGPN
jgi:hypothetical protein